MLAWRMMGLALVVLATAGMHWILPLSKGPGKSCPSAYDFNGGYRGRFHVDPLPANARKWGEWLEWRSIKRRSSSRIVSRCPAAPIRSPACSTSAISSARRPRHSSSRVASISVSRTSSPVPLASRLSARLRSCRSSSDCSRRSACRQRFVTSCRASRSSRGCPAPMAGTWTSRCSNRPMPLARQSWERAGTERRDLRQVRVSGRAQLPFAATPWRRSAQASASGVGWRTD
jgi:hypothetical protein